MLEDQDLQDGCVSPRESVWSISDTDSVEKNPNLKSVSFYYKACSIFLKTIETAVVYSLEAKSFFLYKSFWRPRVFFCTSVCNKLGYKIMCHP